MSLVDDLRAVRAKVEQGWCKGDMAKDSYGNYVHYKSPNACQWCLVGALNASLNFEMPAYKELLRHTKLNHLVDFNDAPDTTQQDVLNLIDRAIESAMETHE